MKKLLLLPVAVLLLLLSGCVEIKEPVIDDFKITQKGDKLNFEIAWSGVEGGIEQAGISGLIHYEKGGKVFTEKYIMDYKSERNYSISSLGGDETSGLLKATTSLKGKSIENADQATFVIIIKDKNKTISRPKSFTIKIDHADITAEPVIESFKITQEGRLIKFCIVYSNINGGIENARLIIQIGFTVDGNRYLMEPYQVDYKKEHDYKIITSFGDISRGLLTITSKTTAKNLQKVEDVTYDIILIDKNGKSSQPKTATIDFADFVEM